MCEGRKQEELLGCATFAQLKLPPDSDLVAVTKAGVIFLEGTGDENHDDSR